MRLAKETNMTGISKTQRATRIPAIASTLFLALALGATNVAAQATGACADSTGERPPLYRDEYSSMASRTDSQTVAFRVRSGLPTLSPALVRIVGDTAVCRAASLAYDAALAVPHPSQPVIVLEVGTRRVVIKDIGRRGPWLNMLFNQDFTSLLYKISF